jgi:hypothetical protein
MGNENETCNGKWRWRQVSNYNYKLHYDSAKLAKRSQKLLCSPAVDLSHYEGGSTKRRSIYRACFPDLSRMLNAAAERGSWVGTASDFPFIH